MPADLASRQRNPAEAGAADDARDIRVRLSVFTRSL